MIDEVESLAFPDHYPPKDYLVRFLGDVTITTKTKLKEAKLINRFLQHLAFIIALLLPLAVFATTNDDLSAILSKQMQINQQRYGIAGQGLLVMRDDNVLFRGVSGYANIQTKEPVKIDDIFAAYSLSKLFVSTLIMQLVDQNQIDLDKPARIYTPDLPEAWGSITVRQFLNHTSGVPDYYDTTNISAILPADKQAAFAAMNTRPVISAPDTENRYIQTNYVVLAAILEAHYGKPYTQIVFDRIVKKLGLKHTSWGVTSLPKSGVVTEYVGKDGQLQYDPLPSWSEISFAHAMLFTTLDDLGNFLNAVIKGQLVSKPTLVKLWQLQPEVNGRRDWFASGWDYGESDGYRQVGHDGGTKVRVRIVFKDTLDSGVYIFVYLTNGSAKNVWSRTLVNSAMAVVAPDLFAEEALGEKLFGFAGQPTFDRNMAEFVQSIRADCKLKSDELERAINAAGYAIQANMGVGAALAVFELNTELFPKSANTWDSLAEAFASQGDKEIAAVLYQKSHLLSAQAVQKPN
jgi:D-alanyl-D-alanine carboxypeptidase